MSSQTMAGAERKAGEAEAPSFESQFEELRTKYSHLANYVGEIEAAGKPTPKYKPQLTRAVRDEGKPNLIYPVGEPLFVHVYMDDSGARAIYRPIEPIIPIRRGSLMRSLDEAIAFRITKDTEFKSAEEHTAKLKEIFESVVRTSDKFKNLGDHEYDPKRRIIYSNPETIGALGYTLIKDKVGLGVIDPLIKDPYLEDISCDGLGAIFVEHKIFSSCATTMGFDSKEHLDEYTMRLSERIGRPATFRRPIIDGSLPDGSRINIVFGEDLSMRGTNFTIRKFTALPISITQLCSYNTIDYMEAAYLWMLLEHNLNVWVCGETASGKTTTVKAVLTFVRPTAKILTIEDTPEVVVPHDNWVREMTRQGEDESTSVGIFDLLKAALRQRPDYIIVGEVRGKEGLIAFQAMQTGHGVMATFHASSVTKLIQRLTGYPIEVPKTYVDVLNAVVFQTIARVPKTGKVERRVVGISEILGYDSVEQSYNFIELFSWDPSTDTHEFRGQGTSYVLEEKVAQMRGLPKKRVKDIYIELEHRAEILRILARRKVFDYNDVWAYLRKIYGLGVEKSLGMLQREEM